MDNSNYNCQYLDIKVFRVLSKENINLLLSYIKSSQDVMFLFKIHFYFNK